MGNEGGEERIKFVVMGWDERSGNARGLTVEDEGQSFDRKRNERKYFQGGKVTKD